MKVYEKPCVIVNEELTEGVYAASGDTSDCMTVDVTSTQEWSGQYHEFNVKITHSTSVQHISDKATVTLTFSDNIKSVESQFSISNMSGNTVTIVRDVDGNAYGSGDNATFKVLVEASDEATTKALTCIGATVSCTHKENVQGGFD